MGRLLYARRRQGTAGGEIRSRSRRWLDIRLLDDSANHQVDDPRFHQYRQGSWATCCQLRLVLSTATEHRRDDERGTEKYRMDRARPTPHGALCWLYVETRGYLERRQRR